MNKPQSPPIYKVTHRSGQVSWQVDLGMVDGKRKRVNFATKARPRTNRIRSRDLSRADRLQRFASCFLSAAVPAVPASLRQRISKRLIGGRNRGKQSQWGRADPESA